MNKALMYQKNIFLWNWHYISTFGNN